MNAALLTLFSLVAVTMNVIAIGKKMDCFYYSPEGAKGFSRFFPLLFYCGQG
jgi:hypothetical protein